jgi:hypothetical protein
MYTLNCSYYNKSFKSLNELINDVVDSGMDPNYEVMFDDKGLNEYLVDLI